MYPLTEHLQIHRCCPQTKGLITFRRGIWLPNDRGLKKKTPLFILCLGRSTMSRKLSQYSCDISISYYGVEAANGCSFFLWGPLENAQALSDTATWSLGQEMAFFTPALTE